MTNLTGSLGVRNEINVDIIGTGARGKEGKSAYEIWLDLGNEGTEQEYLASLKGDDGYTPVKGVDYFDGEKGDKGDKGEDGYTPIKGVDYFDGEQMPISGGVLENYREKLVTLSGTSAVINLSLGNVFTHTLSGNTTYSITNAVNSQAHSFTLIVNMGSTVRTLTFPASVKWQGREIPDMTTASKTYVLTFVSVDGGTNWLGMFGGEF